MYTKAQIWTPVVGRHIYIYMKSYVPKQKRASNPVGNPITFRKSPWVGLRYDRGKVAEFVVTVVRHLCGNLLIF